MSSDTPATGMLDALFDAAPGQPSPRREARIEAARSAWSRLRTGHVPIAIGCSCGVTGAHVTVGDFELDLIDYLEAGIGGANAPQLRAALAGRRIEAVLDALAADEDGEQTDQIVVKIERAVSSFMRPAFGG